MSHRLYLDVPTSVSAGYSVAFDNFNWPVAQSTYDSISRSFINAFETLIGDSSIDSDSRTDIALSIKQIVSEVFYFVGSYINVLACEQADIEYEFSSAGRYYPIIAEHRANRSASASAALQRLTVPPTRGMVVRAARRARTEVRNAKLRLNANARNASVYSMTTNKLLSEWAPTDHVSLRSLISSTAGAFVDVSRAPKSTSVSDLIAERFSKAIGDHDFEPDELVREYIRRIASRHLELSKNAREKNYEKYFNTRDSILLVGTGGSFANRLISHVFQRNDLPVIRFSHGGERGLMVDDRWHYAELMYTDMYVLHGRTEAHKVDEAVGHSKSTIVPKTVKLIAAGSDSHNRLISANTTVSPQNRVRNVMVVPTSLRGSIRPAFVSTGEESVYLEWHLRLLESLRKTDYNIISKRHPKDLYASIKLFDGYAHEEITQGRFANLISRADAFVFDFAASAFMEALCTNKPVVLIEFPHRPLVPGGRDEVAAVCTIVKAEYDENNRIVAPLDEVVAGLNQPVDTQRRQQFVQNYLLSPSDNLSEFTDLLSGAAKDPAIS